MNNLFYLLLLVPLIAVTFAVDDSFACKHGCSDNNKELRIMAGYDTYEWWGIDHHLTGYWGIANRDFPGTDAVTLDKTERTLKPGFIVRSLSNSPVTASFDVTYTVENPKGKVTHTKMNSYTNIVLDKRGDGYADTFSTLSDIKKHSTISYTLKITSIN